MAVAGVVRTCCRMPTPAWHIVTGEYAPTPGGVADYSRSLARALVDAGDEVHVWAPRVEGSLAADPGVNVHPLPGTYGPRAIATLAVALRRERAPQRLLVQYVPHAFGMKALNVAFCAWVATLRKPQVWVMFHEVALPWSDGRRWKANAAAAVTRVMAGLLASRADRVFMSIPGWEPMLRGCTPRWRGGTWLPIPSNIPASAPEAAVASVRSRFRLHDRTAVLGHFGTYGSMIARLLGPAIARLLRSDRQRVALLVGRGGEALARDLASDPQVTGRVLATGDLEAADVACHLLACDILVQPYPDGVSSRRTSVMAGLALGLPIATNEGWLSEPLWRESRGVELARSPCDLVDAAEALLGDPARAMALSERGRALYATRFSLDHTVATLRGSQATEAGP
jgi:glycosyltransferase involved in cell wall biosynthesis